MNKEQLQKDIDAMRLKLSEMEAKLKEPVSKVWKPVKGDKYYFVNGSGDILYTIYANMPSENRTLAFGNVYRTKEEAEAARDKRLAFVRVTNKLRELEGDWVADWGDEESIKLSVFYNHIERIFKIDISRFCQAILLELYSTQEAWQWVIANMESDLKLIYGVK